RWRPALPRRRQWCQRPRWRCSCSCCHRCRRRLLPVRPLRAPATTASFRILTSYVMSSPARWAGRSLPARSPKEPPLATARKPPIRSMPNVRRPPAVPAGGAPNLLSLPLGDLDLRHVEETGDAGVLRVWVEVFHLARHEHVVDRVLDVGAHGVVNDQLVRLLVQADALFVVLLELRL